MYYGLSQLFDLLSEGCAIDSALCGVLPEPEDCAVQGVLFGADETGFGSSAYNQPLSARDFVILAGLYVTGGTDLSPLPENARRFFELSVNAFDAFVHAWMSELPIQAETIRFGRKVLAAAEAAGRNLPAAQQESAERRAAERAANDRGDSDTRTVLEAAYKVWHEIHRLMGLLRFSAGEDDVYMARCAPDHFVLPAMCEHFTQRFGDVPWIIIDEKRRLCLRRLDGEPARLLTLHELSRAPAAPKPFSAGWEDLWRQYHRTINNTGRSNPGLQRQFMPKRYWKYLPEM